MFHGCVARIPWSLSNDLCTCMYTADMGPGLGRHRANVVFDLSVEDVGVAGQLARR